MCLFSIKLSLLSAHLMCHCPNLYHNNYNNNCLFDILLSQLFAILLTMEIFKTRLFCSHATSHRADWILTECCVLCLALLYAHAFTTQSRMFVELSRESYSDFIGVVVFVFLFTYIPVCSLSCVSFSLLHLDGVFE